MRGIALRDAIGYGTGVILSHIQDGRERVIAYGSRTLKKEERCYCVTCQELLTVVYFVKHYWHYLHSRRILIRMDHGALKYLFNFKDPAIAWWRSATETLMRCYVLPLVNIPQLGIRDTTSGDGLQGITA